MLYKRSTEPFPSINKIGLIFLYYSHILKWKGKDGQGQTHKEAKKKKKREQN